MPNPNKREELVKLMVAHEYDGQTSEDAANAMLQVVLDHIYDIVYIENKHGNPIRSFDRLVIKEGFRK